jgi:hypothetical protein
MVQRTVYHNFFQPRAKTHFTFVGVNFTESFQKCLLHNVFGFRFIVYNPQAHAVHGFVVQFVQLELCLLVPLPAQINEFLVNILILLFQFISVLVQ